MSNINIIQSPQAKSTSLWDDFNHVQKQRKANATGDHHVKKVEKFMNYHRNWSNNIIVFGLLIFIILLFQYF